MKKKFGKFRKRMRKPMDLKSIILYSIFVLFFFVATIFVVGLNAKTVIFMIFMVFTLGLSIFKFLTTKDNPIARKNYEEFLESLEDDFDYSKYETEETEGENNE